MAAEAVDGLIAQAHLRHRLASLDTDVAGLSFGRLDEELGDTWYVGRRHVEDARGDPVVVDWRADVAIPFYRATAVDALGLSRRRRFMMTGAGSTTCSTRCSTTPTASTRPTTAASPTRCWPSWSGPDRRDARHRRHHRGRAGRGHPGAARDLPGGAGRSRDRQDRGGAAPGRVPSCTSTGSSSTSRACWSSGPTPSSCATSPRCCPRWARAARQTTLERLLAGTAYRVRGRDGEQAAALKGDARQAAVIAAAVAGTAAPAGGGRGGGDGLGRGAGGGLRPGRPGGRGRRPRRAPQRGPGRLPPPGRPAGAGPAGAAPRRRDRPRRRAGQRPAGQPRVEPGAGPGLARAHRRGRRAPAGHQPRLAGGGGGCSTATSRRPCCGGPRPGWRTSPGPRPTWRCWTRPRRHRRPAPQLRPHRGGRGPGPVGHGAPGAGPPQPGGLDDGAGRPGPGHRGRRPGVVGRGHRPPRRAAEARRADLDLGYRVPASIMDMANGCWPRPRPT